MPEMGRYEKVPRPESIAALIKYLSSNQKVTGVRREGPQILHVSRKGMKDLKVFMTNVYVVGEVDVYDILADHPDVDAIIAMSAWNSYSSSAKSLGKERSVAVFRFKEFLGAVHYDGSQFMDYVSPEDREAIRRLRGY